MNDTELLTLIGELKSSFNNVAARLASIEAVVNKTNAMCSDMQKLVQDSKTCLDLENTRTEWLTDFTKWTVDFVTNKIGRRIAFGKTVDDITIYVTASTGIQAHVALSNRTNYLLFDTFHKRTNEVPKEIIDFIIKNDKEFRTGLVESANENLKKLKIDDKFNNCVYDIKNFKSNTEFTDWMQEITGMKRSTITDPILPSMEESYSLYFAAYFAHKYGAELYHFDNQHYFVFVNYTYFDNINYEGKLRLMDTTFIKFRISSYSDFHDLNEEKLAEKLRKCEKLEDELPKDIFEKLMKIKKES